MYNTFNGWKLKGRRVMAGERGSHRNEYGDYMFHKSQTCLKDGIETITVFRDHKGRFIKQTTRVTTYA